MFRTLLRDESNHFRVIDDTSAISEIVSHKNRLLWIDLESPTKAELNTIQEEFGLHPLAVEDAIMRHQRPKVDQYDTFYLVVFYSVEVDVPGQMATEGRRGLRGSAFHGPRSGGQDGEPDEDDEEEEEESKDAEHLTKRAEAVEGERIVLREITMFMGVNYLITVHDHPVPELEEAARRWRRNAEIMTAEHERLQELPGTRALTPQERGHLKHPGPGGNGGVVIDPTGTQPAAKTDGVGILLYSLLDSVVDNYFPVIDSIVERVEALEEAIFEKFNQKAIESIFMLKKDLLSLRKVLAPERDVLNVLIRRDLPIFEEHTIVYFQDVYDHVVRITDSIDTYRDLLSSALDSFLSMHSNRLNITVQTLTAVSIMLMSIATITGWYGMNFAIMPELTSQFGYPGIILLAAGVIGVEYLFFRRKGWL
ncbi:MAG: magnesium transporter CorA family protein [Chloroflexia bacterium]